MKFIDTVGLPVLAMLSWSQGIEAEPFMRMPVAFRSSLYGLFLRGGDEVLEQTKEQVLSPSDSLTIDLNKNETDNTLPSYNFSLCRPGDGSETDPDGLPSRFVRMQKGNRKKAKAALDHTLEWRDKHSVDTILSRPHAKLDVCKRIFPHYFAGRDPTGHVVFVQRPGKIQMDLGHLNNVTTDDLLMHYVYVLEYCWNILEPRPDQTMTSVIDLGGLDFKAVRQMFHFVKEFVNMMSLNYPQRSFKTLLINAPMWFRSIYRLISPILRESTKSKIEIYSGGQAQKEALQTYLGELAPKELMEEDEDVVIVETGTGLTSPMELDLRAFVSTVVTRVVRYYE